MKQFILLISSLFLLLACQHEVISPLESRALIDLGDSIEFNLPVYSLEPSSATTKALSPSEEMALSDLKILVFQDNGINETFVYLRKTTVIDQGNSFKIRLKKSVGQVRLVCLANLGNDAKDIVNALVVGVEKSVALAAIRQSIPGIYSTRIPMWGESNLVVLDENLDLLHLGTGRGGSIEIYRSMARVNIRNAIAGSTFELTKVYVYNSRTAMAIVPLSIGSLTTAGTLRSTPLLYTLTASDLTSQTLLNTIYIAETSMADATAFVVAGKYNSSATETFYKMTIQKNGVAVDIKRNHGYEILITHISGGGYVTPDEAYNSTLKPLWIRTDILSWTGANIDGLDEVNPFEQILTTADVLYFPIAGGTQTITVLSETDFTITHSIAGVNISPTSGSRGVETAIQITADPNAGSLKQAAFSIVAGSFVKSVSIEQLGAGLP